jgi:hypothetical protein
MILTNRLFERSEPNREAKSIYIFCEGAKREVQYFRYFRGIDSRINIEIYPLDPDDNNSPVGLYEIAYKCVIKTEKNPKPKYEFIEDGDEVWIVIDTDKWGDKIKELRVKCNSQKDWYVAQSNPCFEVWLYYHLFDERKNFEGEEKCESWKDFLNSKIPGGFDSRRHPIYLKNAIENAEVNYEEMKDEPHVGCTQLFRLAQKIYPLIENKLNRVLAGLKN